MENVYPIKKICGRKKKKGTKRGLFKIEWLDGTSSYEPPSSLNCPESIVDYFDEQQQKKKPKLCAEETDSSDTEEEDLNLPLDSPCCVVTNVLSAPGPSSSSSSAMTTTRVGINRVGILVDDGPPISMDEDEYSPSKLRQPESQHLISDKVLYNYIADSPNNRGSSTGKNQAVWKKAMTDDNELNHLTDSDNNNNNEISQQSTGDGGKRSCPKQDSQQSQSSSNKPGVKPKSSEKIVENEVSSSTETITSVPSRAIARPSPSPYQQHFMIPRKNVSLLISPKCYAPPNTPTVIPASSSLSLRPGRLSSFMNPLCIGGRPNSEQHHLTSSLLRPPHPNEQHGPPMEMDSISTTTTMHCTSTSSAFHRPARVDILGHISEPVRSQSLHNPLMNVMESERPLFPVQGNCTTMTQQMHGSLGAMSSSNSAEIAIDDDVECGDGLMVVEEEEEEEKDQETGEKEAEEQANMSADEAVAAAEEASNADDEPAHFQQPLCEKTLQEEEMVLEVKPAGKTAKWYKNGQELEPQTVKWFHNGQELKAADQLEMQVEQQNGGIFRLAIKSALKEDIGTYKILLHNTETVGSAQLGVSLQPMGPVDSNMSYQGEQNQGAADGPGLAEEVHADATEGGAGGGLPIVWEPGRNLGSRIATCTHHDGHKFRFTRKEGNFYRCEGCRTLRSEQGYGRVKTIKIDREKFVTDPTAGHICH